jgi:hypothetical protein
MAQPNQGAVMTDASLSAGRFAAGDFRLGHVFRRTSSLVLRNFPIFFVVAVVAGLPTNLLLLEASDLADDSIQALLLGALGFVLWMVLSTLSQAILLYAAFQDMLGKRLDLGKSILVGLRRLFPALGVSIGVMLLGLLGLVAFVIPGLILFTNCFVAIPVCVVEERGVSDSMRRSADLTAGHRWQIFGPTVLLLVADAIVDNAIDTTLSAFAGSLPALVGHAIWSGVWGAFFAIFAVVAYHDLRVAREGVDTAQIAVVFE